MLCAAGGNWIAAAQDMRGRMYIIDQAGDLYYDSGNPDIGIYAVRVWGWMGVCGGVWVGWLVCGLVGGWWQAVEFVSGSVERGRCNIGISAMSV